MKFVEQNIKLPVWNQDVVQVKKLKRHGELLGGECKRGLIIGSSGSGKTNIVLCLLLHPNGLRFENVFIYSKSLQQSKYRYLKEVLKPIRGVDYVEFSDSNDVVTPAEVKPNTVFIFDDVVCDNQSVMRDYFSFGRHNNIDSFYLCQTYTKIPKALIRDNANLLIIFKQDNVNLKHIHDEHVGTDMSFADFKALCSSCWKNKYDFVVIDKESDAKYGRYRKGFDCFIHL